MEILDAFLSVLAALAIAVVAFYTVRKGVSELLHRIAPKNPAAATAIAFIIKVLAAVCVLVTVISVISYLWPAASVSLLGLLTAAGFAGIIIGLAAQSSLSHVFAGLVVAFSQPIRVGDVVYYQNEYGVVESIGLMHTVIKLRNGIRVVVPNSDLIARDIVNLSLKDPLTAATVDVGISYESDLKKAIEAMLEACHEVDHIVSKPPPEVIVTGFGESSINLRLYAWLKKPWYKRIVESLLYQKVFEKFKLYGVEIPYPRRVVLLPQQKAEVPVEVTETLGLSNPGQDPKT